MYSNEDTGATVKSNEDTDLMAELNGGMAPAATPQEAKELAAAQASVKVNPLVVAPPKKKTAVGKAVAAAEASAGDNRLKGYAVTVEGLYSVVSTDVPGRKVQRSYTIVCNLPSLEGALSVIKNKLLDKMLRMKYPGYVTYHTHEIVDVKPLSANEPLSDNVAYMTLEQLVAYVKSYKVPISLPDYANDVKNIRAAVVDFILNPKDFAVREARRLASIKEDRALEELNK